MALSNKNSGKSLDFCESDCTDDLIAIAADKVATPVNLTLSMALIIYGNSHGKVLNL